MKLKTVVKKFAVGGSMTFIDAKRVKLWRFEAKQCNKIVDLSVNNQLGPKVTELVATYAQADDRFKVLFMLLKDWATKVKLIDASKALLSSYALACMLIAFLQRLNILPCLQQAKCKELITVWDIQVKKGKSKSDKLVKTEVNVGFVKDEAEIESLLPVKNS